MRREIVHVGKLKMRHYNIERTNQGKRCLGRTPYENFVKGKKIYQQMVFEGGKEKEVPIRRREPEFETENLH